MKQYSMCYWSQSDGQLSHMFFESYSGSKLKPLLLLVYSYRKSSLKLKMIILPEFSFKLDLLCPWHILTMSLHKIKVIMHIQETFDISPSVLQGMEQILAARCVGRPKSWGKSGVFRKNKWGKMATAFPPLSLLPNPLLVRTTNQKHWKNSSANHCLKTLLIALRWTKILWSKLLFLFFFFCNFK